MPTGWTEISSSYHNRLIKLDSFSYLDTDGSDTHTHLASAKTTLASGGATDSAYSTGSAVMIAYQNHTHTAAAADQTLDAGTETNMPFYKNYRMIYKNLSDFNGTVPAKVGCLRGSLPSSSEPDYDHWGWDENSDCYIRIASSYGGTGGADNHTHPATLGWNTAVLSTVQKSSGSVSFVKGSTTHGHSSSGINSQATAHTYKWWGAGVCKTSEEAKGFPAGSYAWFDGNVTSAWTAESFSYDGYFCKNRGSSNRAVAQGGTDNTHTHTVTGDCGSITGGTAQAAAGGSSAGVLYSHVHAISGGTFASVLPVPSNFTLRLAYIKNTLSPVQTRTKTYNMDLVLKRINTKSYTSDLLIKKPGINKSYTSDLLIKKLRINKSYIMDLLIKKNGITRSINADILIEKIHQKPFYIDILVMQRLKSTYQIGLIIKGSSIKTYQSDIVLQKNNIYKTYQMDLLLNMNNINKTYQMNMYLDKLNIKNYQVDLLLYKTSNIQYSLGIKIISFGPYRKRRMLDLDNVQQKTVMQKGFDEYIFDPIVDQLKKKDDIKEDIQQTVKINKGFDKYVFDPMIKQLRRKRDL